MFKNFLLFGLLAMSFLACSNDDLPEISEATGIMENAPLNFEDCGWVINVDGSYFKATQLPSQYEQDGLSVYFTYEDLDTQEVCQTVGVSLVRIRLIQISER